MLFLCDHLGHPDGVIHGLTRYCLNVLASLSAPPIELSACFLREPHPAAELLVEAGVRPIFLGRRRWDPRALADLVGLVRDSRADIVHAAGMKGILLGRAAAWRAGCAAVVHLHDRNPIPPAVGWMLRGSAHWTDHAIAVSDWVAEHAVTGLGIEPQRVETLHNGLDLNEFRPLEPAVRMRMRAGWGVAETQPVIGIVARLSPEKGHVSLLRQLPRIRAAVPDVVLMVVGEGPLRPVLEAQARELGVEAAVRFLGQRSDIPQVLAALDVVAVPSVVEGICYTVLEAMACGRPLVVTRVGGIPEAVVAGRSALVVPPADDRALGNALLEVLRSPELAAALGSSARLHAQRFSIDAHVQRLREIYFGLATRVRRPVEPGSARPATDQHS